MNIFSETRSSALRKGALLLALTFIAVVLQPYYTATAWFGFAVAAYSTMANDSIQTLGTFLSSHKKTPWWVLWLVFGALLVIVVSYGWFVYDGHLGFERLDNIPRPKSFHFFSILAPIALLALTQLRIPISTTFLILSMFSSELIINKMLLKSFLGYFVAFGSAFLIWGMGKRLLTQRYSKTYNHRFWQMLQWIATGFLWIFWLRHDTANMVVFLPRQVSGMQLTIILLFTVGIFGIIMYQRGSAIQEIVNEKKGSQDIRAATMIDMTFAVVLALFSYLNKLPMSTTWVFLGVLAGREIIVRNDGQATRLIINDIGRASIGIVVSLVLVTLAAGS